MIKIVLDCFGGDNGYTACLKAAVSSLERFPDLSIILAGDEATLRDSLKDSDYDRQRLSFLNAPEVITPDEVPTDAIRFKKNSSLVAGIELLRSDDSVSGMVSVGSTGALVAGVVLRIGRLRGVIRPAFCPLLPTMNGGIVGVCDSGANVECTPEMLLQFACMGNIYLKTVYNIEKPRIALLNVGIESEKGDMLRKKTYSLLKDADEINFCGNMESRDLLCGKYDLVVCDGFSGNVLIKSTEGACLEMLKKIKKDISSKLVNKIGALFMYRMFMQEKEFMNYENYGGSVMLGAKKVVIKGHGSSTERGIAKCIEQAYKTNTGGFASLAEEALVKLPGAKI